MTEEDRKEKVQAYLHGHSALSWADCGVIADGLLTLIREWRDARQAETDQHIGTLSGRPSAFTDFRYTD